MPSTQELQKVGSMEPDKYIVSVADAVESQMYDHFEFLARVHVDAASRLLDQLTEDIESLGHNPYRNPRHTRPHTPIGEYRWMLSAERYRIIYEILEDEKRVYVSDIEDCRQDND